MKIICPRIIAFSPPFTTHSVNARVDCVSFIEEVEYIEKIEEVEGIEHIEVYAQRSENRESLHWPITWGLGMVITTLMTASTKGEIST